MKNILVIFIAIILFSAVGCSPKAEPTLASVENEPQAVEEAEKPVEMTATPRAATKEDFESGDNWLASKTITTQAKPGMEKSVVQVKDGVLSFEIPDKETYIYTFYKKPQNSDVSIEVTFNSTGLTQNGVALVCRANEELSSWYEARVSSTGMYAMYKYDLALKDVGQNPYKQIIAGTMEKNTILVTKPNTIKFTCKDNQLSLEVNGGKFVNTQQDPDLTGEGLVGIGTMAFDVTPVKLQYDDFAISKP